MTSEPSIRLTPLPTWELPLKSTPQPVTPPINLIFPMTERPSLTQQPSRRNLRTTDPSIGNVPVTPFEVLLAFENPLNAADVQSSASELQVVLADYLLQEIAGQGFPSGAALTGFNLTVQPTGSSTRSVTSRRQYVRNLQAQSVVQVYSYNVNGTANLNSQSGEKVDEQALTKSVDSSVNDALAPENDAALSAYIQSHPNSSIVSTSVAASADTQPPVENSNTKPNTIAIVFGFLLVGLALLSLLFYALTCWKGYKKKAAQRTRERQGVHAVYPKSAGKGQPSPQKNQVQPQAAPGFLASSTIMPVNVDSSEDGSSYEEVESESDSDKGSDAFARELKLAASLDKRAWEDYQRKLKAMEHKGMVLGKESDTSRNVSLVAGATVGSAVAGAAMYSSSKDDDYDDETENEGFEVAESGSTLIIGPTDSVGDDYLAATSGNTFPYGDEESRRIDPPGPRSSSIQPQPRRLDDPSGFRVSQLAMISPIPEEGFEYTRDNFSRSPLEDYSEDSYDPAVQMMQSLTANTSSFSAQAKEAPRPSPTQSVTASFQSSQAVQMSQSSSQNNLRGSPKSQSDMDVVKPIHSVNSENTEGHQPSKDSNSLQSLLTIDIVKEVQKLASFVKKYEMKREKDKMKEAEREERAARSVGDSRSISVSYDVLSEGVASTGRVVMSRNVIGANDDDSMSESSQSDWSSDGDYGPKVRNSFQKKSFTPQQPVPVFEDDLDDINSVESDDRPVSAQGSDDSRLGIHPFNVQQIMAAQPDVEASRRRIAARLAAEPVIKPPVPKPVSKPPVTGNAFKSTVLSPIPGTPDTNDENYDESPAKSRAPLDVISRNVAPNRTPEMRKTVRNSPKQSLRDSPEIIRNVGGRASPGESSRVTSGRKQSNEKLVRGVENVIDVRHSIDPGKSKTSEMPLPKRASPGQKKLRLNALRKHDAILDEDPDIMSALAPSDEDLTKEMLARQGAESPLIKNTPRKSKNSGFNNIISMFESKPKEAIFPPNENWQYNY
jgi:hypothetical protein